MLCQLEKKRSIFQQMHKPKFLFQQKISHILKTFFSGVPCTNWNFFLFVSRIFYKHNLSYLSGDTDLRNIKPLPPPPKLNLNETHDVNLVGKSGNQGDDSVGESLDKDNKPPSSPAGKFRFKLVKYKSSAQS